MLFSQIMKLGFRQIRDNLGQVLRIAVPALILYYGGLALAGRLLVWIGPHFPPALPLALILLITLSAVTLVGVNLSRALLAGETFEWLPRLHVTELFRYGLGALVCLIFAYVIAWLVGFFSITVMQALLGQSMRSAAFYIGPILSMLGVTVISTFLLRLGSTLPAFALNRSFQDALPRTAAWKDFLIIAFITQVILSVLTWGLVGLSSLIVEMTGNPQGPALVWLYVLTVVIPDIIKLVGTLYLLSVTIAAYRILVLQKAETPA